MLWSVGSRVGVDEDCTQQLKLRISFIYGTPHRDPRSSSNLSSRVRSSSSSTSLDFSSSVDTLSDFILLLSGKRSKSIYSTMEWYCASYLHHWSAFIGIAQYTFLPSQSFQPGSVAVDFNFTRLTRAILPFPIPCHAISTSRCCWPWRVHHYTF